MDFLTFEVHFPDGRVREFLLNSPAGRPSYNLLRMLIAEKAPENAAFKLAWRDSNSTFHSLTHQEDFDAAINELELQNCKEISDRSVGVQMELLTPAEREQERGFGSQRPRRRKLRVDYDESVATPAAHEEEGRLSTTKTPVTEDVCRDPHSRKSETNKRCLSAHQDDPTSSGPSRRRRKLGGAKYYTCGNCSTNFFSQTTLDKHAEMCHISEVALDDAADANFQCAQCEENFPSDNLLRDHELSQHMANQLVCEYCGKGFDNQITLDYHMTSCRNSTIAGVFCPQCRQSFLDEDSMREHFRTSHSGLKLVRIVPPPESTAKSTLEDSATCPGSGHAESSRKFSSHPSGQLACYICGQAFTEKQQLGMHLMTHSMMRSSRDGSVLPVCFPTPSVLSPASMEAAPVQNFLNMPMNVQRIGPQFPVSAILSSKPAPPFAFIKSVQGSFPCKVCGHEFENNLQLGRHLLDHIKMENIRKRMVNGCPPTVCALCETTCQDAADLQTHLSGHFREGLQSVAEFLSRPRPPEIVKCRFCRKTFIALDKLWEHTVKQRCHIRTFRNTKTKPVQRDGPSSMGGLSNTPASTGRGPRQKVASPDKILSVRHFRIENGREIERNFPGEINKASAADQSYDPAPASPPSSDPSSGRSVVRIDLKQFSSVENVLKARKRRAETPQPQSPSKLDTFFMAERTTGDDEVETSSGENVEETEDERPPYTLDNAGIVFLQAIGVNLRESGILGN